MLKAVIFDFDGTIIDTESVWYDVYRDVLQEQYGYKLELQTFSKVIGTVNEVLNNELEAEIGKEFDRNWLRKQAEQEFQNRKSTLTLRKGVLDLIHVLHARKIKLAIASSSHLAWVLDFLEKEKLADYFPVILTSNDVERVKPDPELYVKALERLEISLHEAIAVEDSGHGARAAVDAGIKTYVVPNPVTAYIEFPKEVTKLNSFLELKVALQNI